MAVRLEPSEHAAWSRALEASPWSSLAHWCREVVNDSLTRQPIDAGSGAELADISADDAERFVYLCGVLNERAKGSNRLGRVVADSLHAARVVADLAEALLPTVSTAVPAPVTVQGRREKLVNVRLTDEEFGHWNDAALRGGYPRIATWVRYTVAALIGYTLAATKLTVPAGLDAVRRQLAGAVTNLAQLSDVAESYDTGLHEDFAEVHARIADLLRRYHALGKRA